MLDNIKSQIQKLSELELSEKIEAINEIVRVLEIFFNIRFPQIYYFYLFIVTT